MGDHGMMGGDMMGHGGGTSGHDHDTNGTATHDHGKKMMMMHMTFFWGKNAQILFSGWPGTSTGMYFFALIFVFVLAVLVEWLSHCELLNKPGTKHAVAGFIQSLVHTIRVGLAYLVMLAIMSFNGGVFIAVIAGHFVGCLLFGSRVFKQTEAPLHMSC